MGTQRQSREEGIVVLASSSGAGSVAVLFGVIVLIGFCFLPTIVAFTRKVTDKGSVVVINLFLGWTLVGWVVALAMACRSSTRRR
jgi:hypothetical protein